MTAGRLWYSQLDAYDAVRRMGVILARWKPPSPSKERLFILDFYLATPQLLHNTSLPSTDREALRQLRIPRPDSSFISLPSPPLLFQKMAEVQQVAVRTMIAKGLIAHEGAEVGLMELSDKGRELFSGMLQAAVTADEVLIANFLVGNLAHVGGGDISELRRRTGLRRVGL